MVAAKLTGLSHLNALVEVIRVATANIRVGTRQHPLVKMNRQAAIRPSQAVEGEVVTPFVLGRQVHGSLNRVGGDINTHLTIVGIVGGKVGTQHVYYSRHGIKQT